MGGQSQNPHHYKTSNTFCGKNYLEQDAEEKARAAEEGEGNDEAWVLQQSVVGSKYKRNYPKGISSCLAWEGIMPAKIEDHSINKLYLCLYVAYFESMMRYLYLLNCAMKQPPPKETFPLIAQSSASSRHIFQGPVHRSPLRQRSYQSCLSSVVERPGIHSSTPQLD